MSQIINIAEIISYQRKYFLDGNTLKIEDRINNLKRLRNSIQAHEDEIYQALYNDLHKCQEESFLTEYNLVIEEINYHISKLKSWSRPRKVSSSILLFPSVSYIEYEGLGISLIIAPFNYPFLLAIKPLIGAISGGNCSILKPSEQCQSTSSVLSTILKTTFDPEYIEVIQGGKEIVTELLSQKFDIIFFTGSPKVGKIILQAAAETLTPCILELGGKSPCIITPKANIKVAAKRIIWGKLINAGQTCIAPDYLIVHESKRDELIKYMIDHIYLMFGSDIKSSKYYGRIVSEASIDRLRTYLEDGKIAFGGEIDLDEKYFAPTILIDIKVGTQILENEIFGPVLPVLTYKESREIDQLMPEEKPLALYYFGEKNEGKNFINSHSSGSSCINDTLMQFSNKNLPFGGVGNSGMGKYHGFYSFRAFSNEKSLVLTPTYIDLVFRYSPYRYFKTLKKLLTL